MPNAVPFLKSVDEITELMLSAFPPGYLYRNNKGLREIVSGFAVELLVASKKIQKVSDDYFYITETSAFLDRWLAEYGLPNIIFPDVTAPQKAVFAITMMKVARNLVSKEDYENFMKLIGFDVKFYHANATLDNSGFNYSFPLAFSNSVSLKDKITWWIYIPAGSGTTEEYNGIGDAFDIDFVPSGNNIQFAKNILDYLKPDYIIFQYITLYTKQLYGL